MISLVADPQIVTLVAGSEKRQFSVHRGLLCHYSPYFQAALNGRFREAQTKSLELEDDSDLIEWFVHWLYHQRITPDPPHDDPSPSRLFRLYTLAQMFLVPQLQNHVISVIHRKTVADLAAKDEKKKARMGLYF